ncbi:MAG TPA: zinc ABC transporter substrate-binding protein [Oscillatoriales cyanobacterium M4454_W2019_049]|nr:zinc ABC transporter substrate-binding protein [Oscillatoriales cyanobacterium M4454_W2019_049]
MNCLPIDPQTPCNLATLRERRSRARQKWRSVFAVGLTAGLVGCATASNPPETVTSGKPTVVASYSVLCDLTETIAAETIDLACLIDRDRDPHTYSATPSDRERLEKAQLILYGGYEFDTAVESLVDATQNSAPKVAVNEEAVPQPLMGHHHHGEREKHEGETEDAHSHEEEEQSEAEAEEPDPHVWHDVQNAIAMTKVIRDRLSAINPSQAKLYAENADRLIRDLEELDRWIQAQISTIPAGQRTLITTHDALGYYANAYDLDALESLQGLSSDESPTPSRVKELVEIVRQTGVPTLFVELTANNTTLETVAREAGVKVSDRTLRTDGLGDRGSETGTYIGMMKSNTCAIVEGLGGTCTSNQ